MGTPASMSARVEALRQAARREPSCEIMLRCSRIVECGYRWVRRREV
jgi:hypothetical protein